jgi:hypothetical protein
MKLAVDARAAPPPRIGVDFDNTLISYDDVFVSYAAAEGIVIGGAARSKREVRDAIRALPDGETRWQALQGRVYGKGIVDAVLLDGVSRFIRRCRGAGCDVVLISHKTEFGHFDPDRVNLRDAAVAWLEDHGLFDERKGLTRDGVYWESTREAKIQRIASTGCGLFIDDLEEVLADATFPPAVERILLSNTEPDGADRPFVTCRSWAEVEKHVFS